MVLENIDPNFIKVLPELEQENYIRSEAELEALESQIVSDGGIRDPLTLWPAQIQGQKGLFCVDGFGRREIAIKRGMIQVPYVLREFESVEHAKIWIRTNQDSRRNLTDFQRAYYMGRLYNDMVSKPAVLRAYCIQKGIELIENERASEVLGNVYNVSEKTIRRASKLAKGLDKVTVIAQALGRELLSAESGIVAAGLLEQVSDMNLDDLEGISSVEDLKLKVKPLTGSQPKVADQETDVDQVKSRVKPETEKTLRKAFDKFLVNPDAPTLAKLWKLLDNARKESATEPTNGTYMEITQNSKAS